MDLLQKKRFSFISKGLGENLFNVVRFSGTEGLSQCYRFEIELVSTEFEVDLGRALQNPAVFTIHRPDGDVPFNGILAEFEQAQAFDDYAFYRAVLVPRFWWLQLTHHNQVFLDLAIPGILEAVLKDGGLAASDFELRLKGDYPKWEYVCQYRESHFAFVSRWMEREGIYYFFEQTPAGEKLILTDTNIAHTAMPEGRTFIYSPPSGLDAAQAEEVLRELRCRQTMLPSKVLVKDYNYRTPSLEISGQAPVLAHGRGEVYLYGEHFRTPEEGEALAQVRAQELLCREKVFIGHGTVPYIRPGYVFDLAGHYRSDFNQTYLTTAVTHVGNQTAYLISGLKNVLSEVEKEPYYRNEFTTIPSQVQFRPPRATEKARFHGTMNARIDASETGQYAELDHEGRYKVVLPFDLSGRRDGRASAWVRMMQPYAGSDHGMHFPLHKGAEVLLTFIDGDPDRPIIAGAVPNPDHPSQVNNDTQSMCKITTGGRNKIHLEDLAGSERMLFHTPKGNTVFTMGASGGDSGGSESGSGDSEGGGSGGSGEDSGDLEKKVEDLEKWKEK
ncbi:MAG: type VI secretion system tip protein TssI/VgrG, partial [Thermodesulfobacteriota bacterium]